MHLLCKKRALVFAAYGWAKLTYVLFSHWSFASFVLILHSWTLFEARIEYLKKCSWCFVAHRFRWEFPIPHLRRIFYYTLYTELKVWTPFLYQLRRESRFFTFKSSFKASDRPPELKSLSQNVICSLHFVAEQVGGDEVSTCNFSFFFLLFFYTQTIEPFQP